jgi:hypothetical protein
VTRANGASAPNSAVMYASSWPATPRKLFGSCSLARQPHAYNRRILTATSPNRAEGSGVVSLAHELRPTVLAPSEPRAHRGDLSAGDLCLGGCRQLLAFVERQANGLSDRGQSALPRSRTRCPTQARRSVSRAIPTSPRREIAAGRHFGSHGNIGFASSTWPGAGSAVVDQPPPSASISATLATRRLCCIDNAACWSDNSAVCSVMTLV